MTLVDIEAVSPETLTPWKAELLWRLYVDTYNHLTQRYGDELIERNEAGLTELQANRPDDVTAAEVTQFLEGLPQRYLHVFPRDTIYRHIRLARDIKPDEVHLSLEQKDSVWALAVATLDKPFLFSNICGVLSYLGMDILNGQAMTSSRGLVLDVFRFHDPDGGFERAQPMPLLIDAVAGRANVEKLLQSKHGDAAHAGGTGVEPVIAFDNDTSARYTIVEIVAADAPGLLYRISRALSQFKCEIENVVISTEEHKAIDVFHVTKAGAKVPDAEELSLTEALEEALSAA
jgi:[protein-PII] uridylyltransferase